MTKIIFFIAIQAKFTYKVVETENLMDYSNLPPINEDVYSLWHWQWEIANKNVSNLKK